MYVNLLPFSPFALVSSVVCVCVCVWAKDRLTKLTLIRSRPRDVHPPRRPCSIRPADNQLVHGRPARG